MTCVSSVIPVMLSRIEMERVRLASASRAMDGVRADAPLIGEATAANLAQVITGTDDELAELAVGVRRHGVTPIRLEKLTMLTKATDRVVREAFALATGVLARSQGLDGGACAEADSLIAELAAAVDRRLARPTVPGEAEFLHRATDVIRRRLPDHGIWDLPVMAHEFGHVLAAHLKLYDPVEDQILELGHLVLDGWPDCSSTQGEELFCDLLATYAMGPSFACAMLLHRLDPVAPAAPDPTSTHPPDAVRAVVVLAVLSELTRDDPADSRYRLTCDQISASWLELQDLTPMASRLRPERQEGVMMQVRVTLDLLSHKLKPLRYDWPTAEIRELAEALEANQAPVADRYYRIRDVLNAVWQLRLGASADHPPPAHVETCARALIGREHHGGQARDA
jgi:hypothetical protein